MPLRLNNTLKPNHFKCRRCKHSAKLPPREKVCEMAEEFGLRIEARLRFNCPECGQSVFALYDSLHCEVKVVDLPQNVA